MAFPSTVTMMPKIYTKGPRRIVEEAWGSSPGFVRSDKYTIINPSEARSGPATVLPCLPSFFKILGYSWMLTNMPKLDYSIR